MKLFIWHNPYEVDYGDSLLVVAADTVEQARELAKTAKAYTNGDFDDDILTPAGIVLGEPNRILECPCAEWHAWRE